MVYFEVIPKIFKNYYGMALRLLYPQKMTQVG